ncbi:hypothetical protein FRB94_009043 [Tulasnella sp. JGI-2019a]|nr:hypothetical protein FRB93_003429 [Tulasnella sp. JGI-2019a]KAG9014885.1 hypothetical protein FRB94_009043 [Tulasnella sp. JGI-2019a]KAG9039953.1 hypothetical protein FRB95_004425 [Tulasnella sp. JGI-2019a]
MDNYFATTTESTGETHRPGHRRGKSLPADFGSTLISITIPHLARRRSIGSGIAQAKKEIMDARKMLSELNAKVEDTARRTAAVEAVLDQACAQLDDHAVYFDAKYPPAFDRMTDITELKRQTRASWELIREENSSVKALTDDIKPLPYLTGRFPKVFPRRLAGLMALSERQTEGLMIGYGIEQKAGTPSSSLDDKRRTIALFIGITEKALPTLKQQRARHRQRPFRPVDSN